MKQNAPKPVPRSATAIARPRARGYHNAAIDMLAWLPNAARPRPPITPYTVTAATARARAGMRPSEGLRARSPRQDDDVVAGDEEGDEIADGRRRRARRRKLGAQRNAGRERELAFPAPPHPGCARQRREEPVGAAGVGRRAVDHLGPDQTDDRSARRQACRRHREREDVLHADDLTARA